MGEEIGIYRCDSFKSIKVITDKIFNKYGNHLPSNRDATIFIKPNFNSDFTALTGNTTDLRLIAASIQTLKSLGYTNITVGDGTSSGFDREGIDVMARLGVDRLAEHLGVEIADLNDDDIVEIDFEDGVKAGIAKTIVEADFLINMPKVKMHYEADMSVCLKNLIGCCVGRDNKKKVHYKLIHNILNLNRQIKPDLHIVDGIIAMEGTGPSRGIPVNLGLVMVGTDPYLIDMACAEIVRLGYRGSRTLRLAIDLGDVTDEHIEALKNLDLIPYHKRFKQPQVNFLTSLVINPKIQPHLSRIRYAPIVKQIFSLESVKKLIYLTGMGHEYINKNERNTSLRLNVDKCRGGEACSGEKRCLAYCPLNPNGLEFIGGNECIQCMYCYHVCPEKAILIEGDLGYFFDEIKQYGEVIQKVLNPD